MDNILPERNRFVGSTSPVIGITKWHDLKTGEFFFDLYLNGKVDGRYQFTDLQKRLQEVVLDI